MFIFPRLDSPSVVGDEGRPRSTSLGVASAVVLGLAVFGGAVLGDAELVMTLGVTTGSIVAGLALLERHRFAYQFVGTLLAIAFGTVMLLRLVELARYAPSPLLLYGLTLALFGIGLTWTDLGDRDDVGSLVKRVSVGYGGLLFGGLVPVVFLGVVVLGLGAIGPSEQPTTAVSSFLLVVSILGWVGFAAGSVLPIVELTPRSRRADVAERLARVRRLALWVGVGGFALIVPASIVLSGMRTPEPATSSPAESLTVLSSPLLVGPLALVAGLVALAASVAWALKWASRSYDTGTSRQVAALAAGVFVGTILLGMTAASLDIVSGLLVRLLAGPLFVVVAVAILLIAMDIGILPERGGGLALASLGLGGAAVGAAINGLSPPFVFACAAGTVLVWDVSTFGVGLTAELGHVPETRRLELVHAVVVVGLGIAAVAVASGLYALRTTAIGSEGVTAAMALAALGALIAAVPLRG